MSGQVAQCLPQARAAWIHGARAILFYARLTNHTRRQLDARWKQYHLWQRRVQSATSSLAERDFRQRTSTLGGATQRGMPHMSGASSKTQPCPTTPRSMQRLRDEICRRAAYPSLECTEVSCFFGSCSTIRSQSAVNPALGGSRGYTHQRRASQSLHRGIE